MSGVMCGRATVPDDIDSTGAQHVVNFLPIIFVRRFEFAPRRVQTTKVCLRYMYMVFIYMMGDIYV